MKKVLSFFTNSGTAKNAGWLILGKIVQMAIGFFVGVLTARYLGPSNYGIINYIGAYIAFFTALCTLGINSVIVKEIIDHPYCEGEVIGTSIILKSISSFLSALMIVAIVFVVDKGDPTTVAVAALCSIGAVFNVLETFNYWFQSKLKSKITALATLIAYVSTAIYRILLVFQGSSVEFFAFASSVDYIVAGVILFVFYKKFKGPELSFSWEYGKELLKRSSPFIISSLMVAIYGQTDRIMLKQMISETEIGYYALASDLNMKWCFILSAIISSMSPSILTAYKNKQMNLFNRNNIILYAIVFYLSSLVAVLFTILAKPLIQLLYGVAYLPSVEPLRVIAWYTAFSYLGVARNAWVVSMNAQKYLKFIYATAALSNVLLNIVLIPPMGAIGAAIASLIAQIVTVMIAPFFIKDMRANSILMLKAIDPRVFINAIVAKKVTK